MAQCRLTPIEDRVIVLPEEAADQTDGGLFLPDVAKQFPSRGIILAVGPGRLLEDGRRAPMSVSVGDTVLFGKLDGKDIEVDGQELRILRESEIQAVVESSDG